MKTLPFTLLALLALAPIQAQVVTPPPRSGATDFFALENLHAWCVVPFDAKKRGPEERAVMLQKLGFKRFVYDWRPKDIPTFDAEIEALKKHGIELTAWWSPTDSRDPVLLTTLEVFKRQNVHPQLWVMGSGNPTKTAEEQKQRVEQEAERIRKIVDLAAPYGCKVELYNHNGWFGQPDNEVAIIERLKQLGVTDVGMVYNFSHGHNDIAEFPAIWKRIQPHVVALNVTGMVKDGESKLMPPSQGDYELGMMRTVLESGWRGPVGLIAEQGGDAEVTLSNNLRGLERLRKELAQPGSAGPKPFSNESAPKEKDEPGKFGRALDARRRGIVFPGEAAYRELPLTVECWARLRSATRFNVLVANEAKTSPTHWELYSYAGKGDLSIYLPGRGGEYRSEAAICDDRWHHVVAVLETARVRLYVDGQLVKDARPPPLAGTGQTGGLAVGQVVEGGVGCDGWVDEVRLSKGPRPPSGLPSTAPQREPDTIGLWSFDQLTGFAEAAEFVPDKAPLDPTAHPLYLAPVNRDRIYDFYAKQARWALAQHPRPDLLAPFPGLDGGTFGHWGNQDEKTWRDGRWNEMDVGSLQAGVFHGWGRTVPRGVCVRLGERGEMGACFDPETLTWIAAWSGGFVRFSSIRHGFLSGCEPAGERVEIPAEPAATRGSFVYRGFYRSGPRVVFHYTRDGVEWLESAWCEGGRFVRTRSRLGEEPLGKLTVGGPAQWPQVIETQGELGAASPYSVDTITLPKTTPWHSLWHVGDHDFFPNGDAALCTIEGEVWLVRGLDASLAHVRWKRFAAGLHEPLGLKIADGKIYVLGRDQITLLRDLNGDDEADEYECFSNAYQTSPAGHDFITGLQRDAEGRFYFASSNQGVCRVSRDGRSAEVIATGFRNPDGLGLGPHGEVIAAAQEGEWTPASMIAEILPGGHYGYRGPKPGPLGHVPPIAYLPRGLDNSCGGQVFVEGGKWGVPPGSLVHLSFGSGAAFLVIRDSAYPAQSAVVPLPGDFRSGAHRGRFHPIDGQLYVTGTAGWGTYTPDDGCFQRLRYAGPASHAPISFEARDNGVLLTFTDPLEATSATQPNAWFAQAWNYRYGPAYGSDEFSARHSGLAGHDVLPIASTHLLADGRSLFLEIPQLQPAHTLHLYSASVPLLSRDIFLTIHKLGAPFTDFAGYRAIAKTPLPEVGGGTPTPNQPLPVKWESGTPGRAVRIQTTTGLQYVQRELRAKAGERLSLTLENPDVMPHNWVLGARGAVERVTDLANKLVTDPNAVARHYVPDAPEVLVHTRIVEPASSTTIHFNAPSEKGDYPYLCTFPGHATIMRGVMHVE